MERDKEETGYGRGARNLARASVYRAYDSKTRASLNGATGFAFERRLEPAGDARRTGPAYWEAGTALEQ